MPVKRSRADRATKQYKMPMTVLAVVIGHLAIGRAKVIAANTTIRRPMRRELSQVLGLHSEECPAMLWGEDNTAILESQTRGNAVHVGRTVRIPDAVRHAAICPPRGWHDLQADADLWGVLCPGPPQEGGRCCRNC